MLRRRVQGGSTITQQTAKSLLVSAEGFEAGTRRDLRRKLRELILARRLEARLRQGADPLAVPERRLPRPPQLRRAGGGRELLPQERGGAHRWPRRRSWPASPRRPAGTRPGSTPTRPGSAAATCCAAWRRRGPSAPRSGPSAEREEVQVFPIDDLFREVAPFYAEQVRRELVERYGNARVLQDGLRVELAMDLERQRAAQAGAAGRAHGGGPAAGVLGGPVAHLEGAEREALRARLAQAWPALPAPGRLRGGPGGGGGRRGGGGAGGGGRRTAGSSPSPACAGRGGPTPRRTTPTRSSPGPRPPCRRRRGAGAPGAPARSWWRASRRRRQKPCPTAEALLLRWSRSRACRARSSRIEPWHRLRGGAWWAATTSTPPSSTAPSRPAGSPAPPSSPSSTRRLSRSSNYTPATLLTDAPVVYRDEDSGVSWKPSNFGKHLPGRGHAARRRWSTP